MDFTLSKQQQMVQKMYREFAENEVKPLAKKVDAEEYFPKETVEKMGKLGMMGIYFPTSVGGAGGDVLSYVMAVEELSKVCGTTGVILSAHTSLCAAPIFEKIGLLRGKCPFFTPYSIAVLRSNGHFSNAKAVGARGFYARPLRETLQSMILWFQGQNLISPAL